MDADTPTPQVDAATAMRWQYTQKLRRVLEMPTWREDLRQYMVMRLGEEAVNAWGDPSIALNLHKSTVGRLATLYDSAPVVSNPDFASPEQMEWLAEINPFRRHKRLNRLTIGLRECFVRVHWSPATSQSDATVDVELVTPDEMQAWALTSAPTVPVKLARHVRLAPKGSKRKGWYAKVWDVTDPKRPTYRIMDSKLKKDQSKLFDVPPEYEWIDPATGAPYLPWVLYHAEDTGRLFDPMAWSELLDGTMETGLNVTFYTHAVRNACWNQAYGLDVRLAGTSTTGAEGSEQRSIPTDIKSILMFTSRGATGGQIGSLERPADPKYIVEAIIQYADWVLSQIGLSASQAQDAPQSGVALTIRQDGVTRLQKGYVTEFRQGDLALLKVVAQVSNTFAPEGVPALPTEGWRIAYPSAPRLRDELIDLLEVYEKQIAMGLMSVVDALLKLEPELTREQAIDELRRIRAESDPDFLLPQTPDEET